MIADKDWNEEIWKKNSGMFLSRWNECLERAIVVPQASMCVCACTKTFSSAIASLPE